MTRLINQKQSQLYLLPYFEMEAPSLDFSPANRECIEKNVHTY